MAIIYLVVLISLVIFIKLKMPMWKGKYSEKLVYKKMLQLPDEYIIFNDLLFESNGRSTQIDHVVVSPYGVFVIETKGYKGWILGGEKSEYWTQVIYKSKRLFYNPIKQNDGHVRFLRYLLKCSVDIPFFPIVVFNNSANLKVHVCDHVVVNRCNLVEAITQHCNRIISEDLSRWIVDKIQNNCAFADKEELKKHKNHVRIQQNQTHSDIRDGICPRCGGSLVIRRGRYGTFYGCSNYPKCKFTIK